MYDYFVRKLYIAVLEGDVQQLKVLMTRGANINHVFRDHGDTLLHYAHTQDVANFLLVNMAKANIRDRYGQTPLCCAVARPNGVIVVSALLAAGADVNAKMLNGKTPLHNAPNLEMTQLLLQHGAQVNVRDKYGRTPLHAALIDKKGLDVFKCLLDAGADINARMGEQCNSVLHYADSLEIIREILSRGFSVNAVTNKMQTPLHHAVKHMKGLPIIHELLKRGVKVDVKDSEGDIALLYAVRNYKKDYKVIQLLIEYGSSICDLFRDYQLNRRANCLGYTVSRDMELCKLIARTYLIHKKGDLDAMPPIGTDACPKPDRDFILDYINRCGKEIIQLKKYKVFGNYTLYNVIVNKKIPMRPIYTSYRKLQQEMSAKFPYYHKMILEKITPYLHRGRLLNRLRWLRISLKNDKSVITLNPDCTRFIIQLLPDDSLWNLLVATEL